MKSVRIALVQLLVASLLSTTAVAQDFVLGTPVVGLEPAVMWMGDGPGMMLPLMMNKLDLTTEQNEQMRKIMATHHSSLQSLFKQLAVVHEEMADKFFVPGDLQPTDFSLQSQQIQQLRAQLMEEGLKATLAVRRLLTPEQLTKAAQLKERMKTLNAEMKGLMMEEKEQNSNFP